MRRITEDTRFFDHDKVADTASPLAHTFPDTDIFVKEMKVIDVRKTDEIVIYD